jgi:glycosyltransferase involved in cell wall biosynthesis
MNHSQPGISVIIPTKNEEGCLRETLINIIQQKEAGGLPLEIVVVDGGSIDSTVCIANEYADVVVVDSGASKSIASGRNLGAFHSKGSVLIHTDADVHFPDLKRLIEDILSLFANESYVAATAKLLPKHEEATIIDHVMHTIFNYFIRHSIKFGAFLARGELQIVRKSTFKAVGGYDPEIVVGEDCNLFYKLKKKGNIKYFEEHCVFHSVRRFKSYGYLKTLLIYAREGIWLLFLRKNYLNKWEPIR